ncbi:MAG: excinuclease ABC subunit C [Sphingobacteriales bacterium]|jgi:excinuclease ABC subunit C
MNSAFDFGKYVSQLPAKPGVYQYFDEEGIIIYIGKAKNLKSRVSSYFSKEVEKTGGKTKVLVKKIKDIKFIVVESEIDAWLLENNLIKKHQPKYNIQLKDDKTFPFICIKKEPFPRVFSTRRIVRDGSEYFGPYASVRRMKILLDLIKSLYQLRTCNLNLSDKNIKEGKFKVCLEYQIGNCLGPCENHQTLSNYNESISAIRHLLKGNFKESREYLESQLKWAVENLRFELAQQLKEKQTNLINFQTISTVVNPNLTDLEVYSISQEDRFAFVNFMRVINGSIVQSQTLEFRKKLDETKEDILTHAISEFRNRYPTSIKQILSPFPLDLDDENLKITNPQRGEKKKLLELSYKNVLFYKKNRLEQYDKINPGERQKQLLDKLKTDLRLSETPTHIECFDNSNFQGNFPVAAMVVFKDGKPSKKEYRHYNIKTVEGPDDFASMTEVVSRRYKRLLEENSPLPQLIVIDGGKGQLSAAVSGLKEIGAYGKIAIIGIAKRLEEIYFPGDSIPIYLNKKSTSLKTIQHLRDEAHRFGITFHRNKRSKAFVTSELDGVLGLGPVNIQKLLTHFKSVSIIKKQSTESLEKIIPKAKAKTTYDHFHKKSLK